MKKLAPGVVLLAKTIATLLLPSAVLVAANSIAKSHFGASVPNWVLWTACLASAPVLLTCAVWYAILREKYGAWKLGAQPLPRLRGKWIGGIDILVNIFDAHKHGYFCQ